ncbi:MAG TPA: sugar phosphate isomerase/epimerase family protein [Phycisphaerae bacterium]|nr:sugar phosphate isomerase/epimerase family protein [Phycisphaerae bacterium]
MKIGVSSYSFSRPMRAGTMTLRDAIAKAAEMKLDAIELTTLAPPDGRDAASFAQEMRAACERGGLAVANYTVGADFLHGSGGDWRAEAERLKEDLRIAEALGAPGMRHDATRGFDPGGAGPRGFDDALGVLADACRAVTEFAADLGVRTMVENHGFFCQDSDRVEKLVNAVNHPNFGVLVDIGNFFCVDEDPARAVGRLAPYAFHAHAKDFHVKSGSGPDPGEGWFRSRAGNYLRGAIVGHGEVAVGQCVDLLRRAGYDGVLSIEFEGMEDPLEGVAIGAANLRRYGGIE